MDQPSLLVLLAAGAAFSLLVSLATTGLMRHLAPRLGLIDLPSERKVHRQPTPRGGGVAIWLAVVGTFAVGQWLLWAATTSSVAAAWLPAAVVPHLPGLAVQSKNLWILLGLGTLLMVLGLADDRQGLSWKFRLLVELGVAAVAVWLVSGLHLTAFLPWPAATWMLSVVWIVALVNAFNMLDNMDGLSAGVGVITSTLLATLLLLSPDPETGQPQWFVAGMLAVLVGALLGFLWHNRPPARIFMGDSGAYFLGFLLAAGTLLASYTGYATPRRHAILAPVVVMAVPLYDMLSVIVIRLRSGRSPFAADKNHFSHRLVDLGLTPAQAVLTVYLATAACGLAALLLHRVDTMGAVLLVLLVACLLGLIAILETTARRTIRG
jgi:UDP-GlcNAc:undecaprenyl-phosphate GlcNAc-1-phosphate transferase